MSFSLVTDSSTTNAASRATAKELGDVHVIASKDAQRAEHSHVQLECNNGRCSLEGIGRERMNLANPADHVAAGASGPLRPGCCRCGASSAERAFEANLGRANSRAMDSSTPLPSKKSKAAGALFQAAGAHGSSQNAGNLRRSFGCAAPSRAENTVPIS